MQTVLGRVSPDELGPTLMHEHLLLDLSHLLVPEADPALARYLDAPVTVDLLPVLRQWPFSVCRDNWRLDDEGLALEELSAFREAGGSAVVDCTLEGMGRDPLGLHRLAERTGLHVIQGTGFYVERAHPPGLERMSIDAIAEIFVEEIAVGIGDTGVRAGIIGEIGVSGIDAATGRRDSDMTPAEERVLRAAGRACVQTGAAVTVHLDPRGTGAHRAIDVLEGEGVPPERMIMGHMDANPDGEYHLRVAARGVFVELDHFGREYYAGHMQRPYTKDERRIELLVSLVRHGFASQLLVSQDVCAKIDLHRHGGNGYDHVLCRIVPRLREAGVDEHAITAMLVENPRRALAF